MPTDGVLATGLDSDNSSQFALSLLLMYAPLSLILLKL